MLESLIASKMNFRVATRAGLAQGKGRRTSRCRPTDASRPRLSGKPLGCNSIL